MIRRLEKVCVITLYTYKSTFECVHSMARKNLLHVYHVYVYHYHLTTMFLCFYFFTISTVHVHSQTSLNM
jgi:hypothetical protein